MLRHMILIHYENWFAHCRMKIIFLGKEDIWDNLVRIKDIDAAAELLEISIGNMRV